MRFTLAFLAGVALAAPAPSPAELAPRACTTILPSYVGYLDRAYPNQGGLGSNPPTISLDRSGTPLNNTQVTILRFNPPAGATGCTLVFHYQYPSFAGSGTTNTGDVFLLKTPAGPLNTWNNPPLIQTQVSQVRFPLFPNSVEPDQYLWASTCSSSISFEVAFSTWQQQPGHVGLTNEDVHGFKLIYNC